MQKQPPEVFCKKAVLRNFAIFTGKQLCWSPFLIKLHSSNPSTLLKKSPTKVFSCEYCKIPKINYLEKHGCFGKWFRVTLKQFYDIFIIEKLFYNVFIHQVKCCHFFIVEIIIESVSLTQI